MEIYTAVYAILQQNGGQIDSEVEVDFHAVVVGEFQMLYCLAEVPVRLVLPDFVEDLAEGDFLFLLILQKSHTVQTVISK